jgi:hypothetical protein
MLLFTWIRLRRNGYQKTLSHINHLSGPVVPPETQVEIARETAFALAIAIRVGPWKPRCLLRSLTLVWILKRRGIPSVIRIGVPHGATPGQESDTVGFSAHAWVEHAGIVLNDRQDVATQLSAFDTRSGSA